MGTVTNWSAESREGEDEEEDMVDDNSMAKKDSKEGRRRGKK